MKIIAFILVILMVFATVIACGENQNNIDETTKADIENPAETTSKEISAYDYLPEKNYNGQKFVIFTPSNATTVYLPGQIITQEAVGDIIMDAAYYRNRAVEEKYNIEIVQYDMPGTSYFDFTPLRNSIMAGDQEYDLVASYMRPLVQILGSDQLFLDASQLPYMDLEKPWYPSINEGMKILDKQSIFFSDFTCIGLCNTYAIFYNYDLAEKYNVKGLQELAMEGKWTIDVMLRNVKGIATDLNGDGKMDENDQYGMGVYGSMLYNLNDIGTVMQYGMGQFTTKLGSDGLPVLDVMNERTATIATKLNELFWGGEAFSLYRDNEENVRLFAQNQILFFCCIIMHAPRCMREMTDDYRVLPMPKYDLNQENYYTSVSAFTTMIYCIPVTVRDIEFSSMVFEALSYEGYNYVIPAFFEVAMKVKYSRDEISSQTFDLIRDSSYVDFGLIYDGGVGMATIMSTLISKKSTDLASEYAKIEEKTIKQYESIIEVIKKQ